MLQILNIENREILTELPISRAEESANQRRLPRHSFVPDTLCYRGRLFLTKTVFMVLMLILGKKI